MDNTGFATLTRGLSTSPTRRSLTQVLAGLTLSGGLGSLLGLTAVEAKKKHHKSKNKPKQQCKGNTKECDGECITKTHCCGGCAYYPGLTCCGGRCANCCSGDDCESGVCIHGVCLAVVENDIPIHAALEREMGGFACVFSDTPQPCADDDDCAFGRICLTSNVCSTPHPLPE